MEYAVEYIDKDGRRREDTFEAKSLVHLFQILKEKGLRPVLIFTKKEIDIATDRALRFDRYYGVE